MAKNKIKPNYNTNFQIIGVKTNFPHYKTAWTINKLLDTKLAQLTDADFPVDFVIYRDKNFILIENSIDNKPLLNELKEFSFILKIFNYNSLNEDLKMALKTNEALVFSGVIEKSKLRAKSLKMLNEIEI